MITQPSAAFSTRLTDVACSEMRSRQRSRSLTAGETVDSSSTGCSTSSSFPQRYVATCRCFFSPEGFSRSRSIEHCSGSSCEVRCCGPSCVSTCSTSRHSFTVSDTAGSSAHSVRTVHSLSRAMRPATSRFCSSARIDCSVVSTRSLAAPDCAFVSLTRAVTIPAVFARNASSEASSGVSNSHAATIASTQIARIPASSSEVAVSKSVRNSFSAVAASRVSCSPCVWR